MTRHCGSLFNVCLAFSQQSIVQADRNSDSQLTNVRSELDRILLTVSAAKVLWLEDDPKAIDKVPIRNFDTSELV